MLFVMSKSRALAGFGHLRMKADLRLSLIVLPAFRALSETPLCQGFAAMLSRNSAMNLFWMPTASFSKLTRRVAMGGEPMAFVSLDDMRCGHTTGKDHAGVSLCWAIVLPCGDWLVVKCPAS